jgi:hypothetical protein
MSGDVWPDPLSKKKASPSGETFPSKSDLLVEIVGELAPLANTGNACHAAVHLARNMSATLGSLPCGAAGSQILVYLAISAAHITGAWATGESRHSHNGNDQENECNNHYFLHDNLQFCERVSNLNIWTRAYHDAFILSSK